MGQVLQLHPEHWKPGSEGGVGISVREPPPLADSKTRIPAHREDLLKGELFRLGDPTGKGLLLMGTSPQIELKYNNIY